MKMRRTVSYVALVVLLVGTSLLAVGVHFLHAFQVKRNAHVLLEQADQAEQNGKEKETADLLTQYLGMVPDDTVALARYGMLADKLAKTPRQRFAAFFVLEKVVRLDASRSDVRRYLARMAVDLRRYSDARYHLEILRKDNPNEVDLLHLQARCEVGDFKYDKAKKLYAQAIKQEPFQVEMCQEYAELLRQHLESAALADEVIEQLLKTSPKSKTARLAAARYYAAYGALEKAEAAVKVAVDELGANDADTFLLAADVASARRNPKQAQEYLERGLKQYPDDWKLSQSLARLDLQAGRRDEAWDKVKPATKTLPTQPEDLWSLGNLLIALDRQDEVDNVIQRLMTDKHKWAADALRARLYMRQEAWGEALALLEAVLASHPPTPGIVAFLELLVATCAERLGNPDQQLRAATDAMTAKPSPEARLAMATALTTLGRTDEAIQAYKLLPEPTPEIRVALGRQLLGRNLRLSRTARSWEELDSLLKLLPVDMPAQLLRASTLVAQDKVEQARELIEAERKRDPKQVELWLFLINLAEQQKQSQTILPLVDQAEREAGRRPEWTLVRIDQLLKSMPAKPADELKKFEADLQTFQGSERDLLLRGLGQAYLVSGDAKNAARLWRELARRRPTDLEVRRQLIELAQGGPAEERPERSRELEQLVAEVRHLEGGEGALTSYGEAARSMLRAQNGDQTALAEARRQLHVAAKLRPSWSAVALLEAEAFDIEGRGDKALEKYQTALEQGELRLPAVRRVVDLLVVQGRYAEAQALLTRLPKQAQALGGLDRVGLRLALLNQYDDVELSRQALAKARQTVPADSKNYRDHLWLGQLCLLAGDLPAAEKSFRRARDLDDRVAYTWVALFLVLAQTDQNKVLEDELAAAAVKLPPTFVPLILATGYEALGQKDKAEQAYKDAVTVRPDSTEALRNLAGFYTRIGQTDKAESTLRKLLALSGKALNPDAAWGRRTLALALATRGNNRQFQEALELVKERPDETPEDRGTRALVLGTRPEHRREAIRLFEILSPKQDAVAPFVRFQLAYLYETDGNWLLAAQQLRSMLEEQRKNVYYHSYYVRALLRHNEVAAAREAVARLAKLEVSPLELVELRARVLVAEDKTGEAVKLVQAYAREKDARLDAAATLLNEFGAASEAESLYRAQVATSKNPPVALLMLAVNLGRQGKVAPALDVCDQVWDKNPDKGSLRTEVVRVGVAVLKRPEATDKERLRVEQHLTELMKQLPTEPLIPLLLADLEEGRGHQDEAIAIYRRVLAKEPKNAFVLNNLAFRLALTGDTEQALTLIQTAIDEGGPHPELIDTRALVYLQSNHPDFAIRDLLQAITQEPTPIMYVHLAQAYKLTRDLRKAKEAFKKAKELGLRFEDVHALEQKAVNKLKADFE